MNKINTKFPIWWFVIVFIVFLGSWFFVWANLSSLYSNQNQDKLTLWMWNSLVNEIESIENRVHTLSPEDMSVFDKKMWNNSTLSATEWTNLVKIVENLYNSCDSGSSIDLADLYKEWENQTLSDENRNKLVKTVWEVENKCDWYCEDDSDCGDWYSCFYNSFCLNTCLNELCPSEDWPYPVYFPSLDCSFSYDCVDWWAWLYQPQGSYWLFVLFDPFLGFYSYDDQVVCGDRNASYSLSFPFILENLSKIDPWELDYIYTQDCKIKDSYGCGLYTDEYCRDWWSRSNFDVLEDWKMTRTCNKGSQSSECGSFCSGSYSSSSDICGDFPSATCDYSERMWCDIWNSEIVKEGWANENGSSWDVWKCVIYDDNNEKVKSTSCSADLDYCPNWDKTDSPYDGRCWSSGWWWWWWNTSGPKVCPDDVSKQCNADMNSEQYLAHPDDCRKYCQCSEGIAYELDCLPWTVFDNSRNICDRDHKVNCWTRPYS